jgi:hypothetical protein
MVSGLRVVEIPHWREEVKGFNDMEDEMNRHQLGNSLEWETVAGVDFVPSPL